MGINLIFSSKLVHKNNLYNDNDQYNKTYDGFKEIVIVKLFIFVRDF